MNIKFLDSVLKYFTVIICCAVIGLFVQEIYSKNNPNISGNIVFLIVSGSAFIIYAIIVVILNEIIPKLNIGKFSKNKKTFDEQIKIEKKSKDLQIIEVDTQTSTDGNYILNEGFPTLKNEKVKLEDNNLTVEDENHITEILQDDDELIDFSDIEKIRILAKSRKEEVIQEKLKFIVQYTKLKLAPFTTDEDLVRLCEYLLVFLRDGKIENINPIYIPELSTADLRHFGWNVWNHYRGNNKRIDVAKFLKLVFSQSFKEVAELETIEKLLTSKNDGEFIKIQKDLLQ